MKKNEYSEILMHEKKADQEIIDSLEKKIYDLRNVIEIGMSLSSNLNFEKLIDSILYSCIGQLFIENVVILLQTDLDINDYYIHRSKGYSNEIENNKDIIIDENSNLLNYFNDFPEPQFYNDLSSVESLKDSLNVIDFLKPQVIVPMKSKNTLNGFILLGKKITGKTIDLDEKEFLKGLARFAAIAVENSRLYHMATLDRMTKLFIHHFFQERLKEEIKRHKRTKQPLSLIISDIDNFKKFNDTYGHQQGDIVIKQAAKIFKENVKLDIDVPARYGGEEFAIILPDTNISEALKVATRLRKNIEAYKFPGQDTPLHVTISLGVAQYDPKRDPESKFLIERADRALYKAKKSGRNKVAASK